MRNPNLPYAPSASNVDVDGHDVGAGSDHQAERVVRHRGELYVRPTQGCVLQHNCVMRALVQRVERASVTSRASSADHFETVGEIGAGLCVFVGVTHDDTSVEADKLAKKLWGLRIFNDEMGTMNLAAADVEAQLLVVSQFTLYGNTEKGRRPSWVDAARPEQAEPLVERVVDRLRAAGATVATGRFRTDMQVDLVNDGPVTLMIET